MNNLFSILMVLNALWFGAAFYFFCIQSTKAAKLLLTKENRTEPVFSIIAHSLKFLGGMNLALAVLAIASLLSATLYNTKISMLIVFTVAHGSQFLFNVSIANREYKKQQSLWSVLSGRMLFIFIVDGALAILNLALAGFIFSRW